MNRERLIIAFQHNLGHRRMSHLADRAFLWCLDSPANRQNAEAVWADAKAEPMMLTLWDEVTGPPQEQLDQLVASGLEHHPHATALEVLGWDDKPAADAVAMRHGLKPVSEKMVYVREAVC